MRRFGRIAVALATGAAAIFVWGIGGSSPVAVGQVADSSGANAGVGDVASAAPDEVRFGKGVLGALDANAHAVLGARFGEIRVAGNTIEIAAVAPTAADASALRKQTGLGSRLVLKPTDRSEAQLQALVDRVTAGLPKDVDWAVDGERDYSGTTVTSKVAVLAKHLDASVIAGLQRLVPAGALSVQLNPSFGFQQTHADRTVYPPYEGGLQVEVVLSAYCTSNFVYQNGYGPFGSTAGHCGRRGVEHPIKIGNDTVDKIRNNQYWTANNRTYTDTAFYVLPPSQVTARLMIGPNAHRTVTSRTNGPTGIGVTVCWQGIGSGGSGVCSATNRNSINVNNAADGVTLLSVDCVAARAIPGDSGGPVYRQLSGSGAQAAGSVHGNLIVSQTNYDMCFTRIQYAVWFFGEVVTG